VLRGQRAQFQLYGDTILFEQLLHGGAGGTIFVVLKNSCGQADFLSPVHCLELHPRTISSNHTARVFQNFDQIAEQRKGMQNMLRTIYFLIFK